MSLARRTAIFAKRPVPGAVKTRLVPPLTPGEAAELARCMLLDGLERLARWSRQDPLGPVLAFAPATERTWFEAQTPPGVELRAQCGADLGERLAAHFEDEFRRSPGSSVVVVGADAPLLARTVVYAAHAALAEGADLVLSPDLGGGYALVGLSRPCRELFTAVPMSAASMAERTLALAAERGLAARLLPTTGDVDVERDLVRLGHELASLDPDDPDRPPRTARWLARWVARPGGPASEHAPRRQHDVGRE